MQSDVTVFLEALAQEKATATTKELLVALIWWHSLADHSLSISVDSLAENLESAGHAKQNLSRLRDYLAKDRRVSKGSDGCFYLNIKAKAELNDRYLAIAKVRPVRNSDSILPSEVFRDSRGYIKKVVSQINSSYDNGLYDCCAVMCRRLAETLLIEVYEAKKEEDLIKDAQNHFLMFSGLLLSAEKHKGLCLSRNALKGLKDFKLLGDLSAHNRRFNAKKNDIDRIRDGLRIACEELIEIAQIAD